MNTISGLKECKCILVQLQESEVPHLCLCTKTLSLGTSSYLVLGKTPFPCLSDSPKASHISWLVATSLRPLVIELLSLNSGPPISLFGELCNWFYLSSPREPRITVLSKLVLKCLLIYFFVLECVCVEVRGQLVRVGFLLFPCRFRN